MEINFYINDPLRLSLLIAFAAVALIQLLYFWIFFSRLAFYRRKQVSQDKPPVSVIITSHSELNFLGDNLPFILEQDYPKFEVVVVNDNSDHDTSDFLKQLSLDNEKLQIVELQKNLNWFKGKKFPLSIGIRSAKYNLIVLTDADCQPVSNQWLSELVSARTPNTGIILGYSGYATKSKINKLLRFSAFFDALFFLSMALAKMPFKGVGKNLSYTRPLFYQQQGFISHYVIKPGDDELFVNKAATGKNTRVIISPDSKVVSIKPLTFGEWLKVEKTRLRLRKNFRFSHRFWLFAFSFSRLLFFGLFAALLLLGVSWIIVVPVLVLRLITQWLLFGMSMKKLTEKNLWFWSPFFEIFIMFTDIIFWFILTFSRNRKWA